MALMWFRMSLRPVCQLSGQRLLSVPPSETDGQDFTGVRARRTWEVLTWVLCFGGSALARARHRMAFKAVRWVRARCSERGGDLEGPSQLPESRKSKPFLKSVHVCSFVLSNWKLRLSVQWEQCVPFGRETAFPRRAPGLQRPAVRLTVASFCLSQDLKNRNMLVRFYGCHRLKLG